MKKNCHNFKTGDDIDMKLGLITKIDKRKLRHVGKLCSHCQFLIYGLFGAVWKPDSGRIICKTYIFINSNLLSYKNWKQN